MKEGIHPNYQPTTIKCACGEVIETRSTKQDIKVEICSKCHPFFTGKQKLVDTGGRVDKFKKCKKEDCSVITRSPFCFYKKNVHRLYGAHFYTIYFTAMPFQPTAFFALRSSLQIRKYRLRRKSQSRSQPKDSLYR